MEEKAGADDMYAHDATSGMQRRRLLQMDEAALTHESFTGCLGFLSMGNPNNTPRGIAVPTRPLSLYPHTPRYPHCS